MVVVSAITVLNCESGIYKPGANDIIKLSGALGVSADYLLENEDKVKEKGALKSALNRLSKEQLVDLIVGATKD